MSDSLPRRLVALFIGFGCVAIASVGPAVPVRAATGTADVSLTMSGPASVNQGEDAIYSVVVHNAGPDSATGVVITDQVPNGFAFDSSQSWGGSCTVSGSAVTCALDEYIPPQAQLASQLAFRTTTTGTFSNSVTVSETATDPTPDDHGASVQTVVNPPVSADMSVSFGGPFSATVGQSFSIELPVANHGPDDSTGSSVSLSVPSGLTPEFGGCSPSPTGSVCTLTTGSQPRGTTLVWRLQFTPTATGTFTLSATVTGNLQDPNSANDTTSTTGTVTARADLAVTSSASPNPVVPGHQVTETIVLANNGPSPASGVSLSASWTSDAKGGIDFESASVSAGSCSTSSAALECSVGDVAKGQQVVLTIVLQPRSKGTLTIDSSATANTPDPTSANNSATTTVQIS